MLRCIDNKFDLPTYTKVFDLTVGKIYQLQRLEQREKDANYDRCIITDTGKRSVFSSRSEYAKLFVEVVYTIDIIKELEKIL